MSRLKKLQSGEIKKRVNGAEIENVESVTPEVRKDDEQQKPVSRLSRMKLRAQKAEAKKKDVSFLKRSVGQQTRHEKDKPVENKKVVTGVIGEKKIVSSRLGSLGISKAKDQAINAKRVKVQLDGDDSSLKESDADAKSNRRDELMADILNALDDDHIDEAFKIVPFELLDESQQHAVKSVRKHKYAIINGPAGTGKTTVTQHVVEEEKDDVEMRPASVLRRKYESNDVIHSIAFVAFTGKATQNMREKLPPEFRKHNCMTIHRLLGYAPEYEEVLTDNGDYKQKMIFSPTYDQHNHLKWDIIYIDEAGMAPAKLINEILLAAPHASIRFIGDSAQLPAVHGLAPFNAYLTCLPTYSLDKVHRTSDDDLVMHATNIRMGERVEFNRINCWHKLTSPNQAKAQGQVVSAIVNLHNAGGFDPKLDTIISPINDKEMGQFELNRLLRHHFNPEGKLIVINAIKSVVRYAVGDKVMVTSNDDEQGLTNGMTGYIVDIERNGLCTRKQAQDIKTPDVIDFSNVKADHSEDKGQRQASHITYVYFPTAYAENKIIAFSTQGAYSALQHGYVTTCHKAQGSEYRNVVIVMHPQGKRLINREWFYTAWTRAKEKVYVLSDLNSLACARNKQALKGKDVADKAAKFIEKHAERIKRNTELFFATNGEHADFQWECPVFIED